MRCAVRCAVRCGALCGAVRCGAVRCAVRCGAQCSVGAVRCMVWSSVVRCVVQCMVRCVVCCVSHVVWCRAMLQPTDPTDPAPMWQVQDECEEGEATAVSCSQADTASQSSDGVDGVVQHRQEVPDPPRQFLNQAATPCLPGRPTHHTCGAPHCCVAQLAPPLLCFCDRAGSEQEEAALDGNPLMTSWVELMCRAKQLSEQANPDEVCPSRK